MPPAKLRVIPLGGLGEIGKNMMALEYGDDILVIDAGVQFPSEDMLGVDLAIPDISYLMERRDKVRAILITHGHEDHTGALPYVLPRLKVPVYAPRLAHGLISVKLREQRSLRGTRLEVVEPGKRLELGPFRVEFFRVCHSIPDAMGIAIRTPLGLVLHTGDFKIDHTPIDGKPTDFPKLAQLASEGVFLLFSDSTYAELPGFTPSERVVGETLDRVIGEAPGRVMVASFASLISRIQQVINAAAKHQRRVGVVGRSMVNNVKMALEMGYLEDEAGVLASLNEVKNLPNHKVVIATTGSQGEPTSALVRMANREHREVQVVPGDTVVLSASPIPGNETLVSRTINNLTRRGARVLYERNALVHVHGHASQEELKLMLNLLRPKYFVPVHGEYRHLVVHASLARALGVAPEDAFVLEDGDVLELTSKSGAIVDRVPLGDIFVDGRRVWDAGSVVLQDRQTLSREGIVVVVLPMDRRSGRLVGKPKVLSRGFTDVGDSTDFLERTAATVSAAIAQDGGPSRAWEDLDQEVQDSLSRFLYNETGRHPMIIPVPVEV